MIAYVTGPLGAGKTYYGCRKIADGLLKGKVVLTNVQLAENWEHTILSHAPHYRIAGKRRKREFRMEMRERYAYVPSIDEIVHARIHGRGQERGIRVIDEAHNEINNREWAEHNQKQMLKVMALSRKRGWDDYIIAQHQNNTDAALRRIATVEIRMVDWQQVTKLPVFQTKLLPFHLFLAQAYPTNIPANVKRAGTPLWKELFLLSWQRKLYNTFQDYEIENFRPEEFDGVILPVPGAYDFNTHKAAQALDIFFLGYRKAIKMAEAEASAIREGIVREITSSSSRPLPESRRPLPRPSGESRTSSDPRPAATSGSGA